MPTSAPEGRARREQLQGFGGDRQRPAEGAEQHEADLVGEWRPAQVEDGTEQHAPGPDDPHVAETADTAHEGRELVVLELIEGVEGRPAGGERRRNAERETDNDEDRGPDGGEADRTQEGAPRGT